MGRRQAFGSALDNDCSFGELCYFNSLYYLVKVFRPDNGVP